MAHIAGTLLESRTRDLFGVCTCMGESDADLGARRHIARACALIRVGEVAVTVVQVDLEVRASVVADSCATERTDDADPYVLLAQKQGRWMCIEDLAEVTLATRLPVRGSLH